ncbi:hypothetical protein HK102_006552 [Quaeritorhiza haematococci]|nr:hypothetical protein HK102_006552 [Quaeritorhiza haematococci]
MGARKTLLTLLVSALALSPTSALPLSSDAHDHLHKRGATPSISKCVNPGQFAMTFDDGPSALTKEVLSVLKQKQAKATFFINGDNVGRITDFQTEIRTMIADGHMIASHTYTHANLSEIRDDAAFINQEIRPLEEAIFNIVQVRPAYFRPPFGLVTERQLALLGDLGYKASVLWNVDTFDWQHGANTPANIDKSLKPYVDALAGPRDGIISLQHDIQPVTAARGSDFVARAVDMVRNAGYELVLVDECLGDKGGAYVKGVLPNLPAPSPVPSPSTPSNCGRQYTVVAGDYCYGIAEKNGLEFSQFTALNPGLVCDPLSIGAVVCVTASGVAPSPAPSPSPSSTCSKPYTVVAGDYCYKIAVELNNLDLNQFLSFNPGLNCDNLQVGQVVCLVAPTTSTGPGTTTTTTTTTTIASPAPSPRPATTCSKPYTVVAGDYCYKIAVELNSLDLNQFLSFNPGLNCDNLQIGQVVCLVAPTPGTAVTGGTPTTTTTTTTTTRPTTTTTTRTTTTTTTTTRAPSSSPTAACVGTFRVRGNGMTCATVARNNDITVERLISLNPGLNCAQPLRKDRILCIIPTLSGFSGLRFPLFRPNKD